MYQGCKFSTCSLAAGSCAKGRCPTIEGSEQWRWKWLEKKRKDRVGFGDYIWKIRQELKKGWVFCAVCNKAINYILHSVVAIYAHNSSQPNRLTRVHTQSSIFSVSAQLSPAWTLPPPSLSPQFPSPHHPFVHTITTNRWAKPLMVVWSENVKATTSNFPDSNWIWVEQSYLSNQLGNLWFQKYCCHLLMSNCYCRLFDITWCAQC